MSPGTTDVSHRDFEQLPDEHIELVGAAGGSEDVAVGPHDHRRGAMLPHPVGEQPVALDHVQNAVGIAAFA